VSVDKLYWVDLETFGLSPNDPIIEISLAVTDLDLQIIDEENILVWSAKHNATISNAGLEDWAVNTHRESGLLAEAELGGAIPLYAERQALDFLARNELDRDPICGASVHADRTWLNMQMPTLIGAFGYRNIDVSTLKELCKRFNASMYAHMEDDVERQLKDAYGDGFTRHRGQWDLRWSIFEMRWYKDNFLFTVNPGEIDAP